MPPARARPARRSSSFGFSDRTWLRTPLPLDLGPYGAPGCLLYCSLDGLDPVVTNASGAASFRYTVPNDPSLVGGVFFNEYLVTEPLANALGIVTTSGGRGLVGNL